MTVSILIFLPVPFERHSLQDEYLTILFLPLYYIFQMTNCICILTRLYQPTFDDDINKVKGSTQGVDVTDGTGVDKRINFIEVDTEIEKINACNTHLFRGRPELSSFSQAYTVYKRM